MKTSWPVRLSPELRRIIDLPRRAWDLNDYVQPALELSWRYLTDWGRSQLQIALSLPEPAQSEYLREAGMAGYPLMLKPEQALALIEFGRCGGLYLGAQVGIGKTLISWLLTRLSHDSWGTTRHSLFVSSSGYDQTLEDFAKLAMAWANPAPPRVHKYGDLSVLKNAHMFCHCRLCTGDPHAVDVPELRPEQLTLDESDMAAGDSARAKRFDRLMANHLNEIRFVAETGTPIRNGIRDCRKHMIFALGQGAPVPFDFSTTEEIATAIDLNVNGARRDPGALYHLADQVLWKQDPLKAARLGMGRRIAETPGVVLIDRMSSDAPITINVLQAPPDDAIGAELGRARAEENTLDGWPLTDGLSINRYETEIGQGFYSMWDPRPPGWWYDPRKACFKFIREQIKASQRDDRKPLDSDLAVFNAFKNHPLIVEWKRVEKQFEPRTVYRAITFSVVAYVAEWLRQNSPALVWVQSEWFGETLSKMTGVPYYAGKGRDAQGRYIGKHDPSQSAILSVHANRRQRNLQRFGRSIVVAPESSGKNQEQRDGRNHRQGRIDPVEINLLTSCGRDTRAIHKTLAEAEAAKDVMILSKKIQHADWRWYLNHEAADPESLPDGPTRMRWI